MVGQKKPQIACPNNIPLSCSGVSYVLSRMNTSVLLVILMRLAQYFFLARYGRKNKGYNLPMDEEMVDLVDELGVV